MDDQSLRNVLAILRLVQANASQMAGAHFLMFLATGVDPTMVALDHREPPSPATIARIAAYLLDQSSQARAVIDGSQLVEEAKAGVRSALDAIDSSFSVPNLNNKLQQLQVNAPSYISNLVILLSATGAAVVQEVPEEALSLADDIEKFIARFDDPVIDPAVREVARKHMAVLSTLLRHVPIFGVEASLQSYFELISRLRRADSRSADGSKGRLDGLMETVASWSGRIKAVDEAVNSGANLLTRAQVATPLLQSLPGLG